MTVFVVDAFAERPFTGNPAAVCLLGDRAPDDWMQALAMEMNLSETAFVEPGPDGAYGLRWFTPTAEVDLCGHATLACAHVLYETGRLAAVDTAAFNTRSGRLTVTRHSASSLTMDFPATVPAACPLAAGFVEALGFEPTWFGRSRFDWFAVAPDERTVRACQPNAAAVAALGMRGVIVTARANASSSADVVSRFFAPAVGVPEDPVTGSAHCAIGPYWSERLRTPRVRCHQASRRGGTVDVDVQGDRVHLTGSAVTVLRGELDLGATPQPL